MLGEITKDVVNLIRCDMQSAIGIDLGLTLLCSTLLCSALLYTVLLFCSASLPFLSSPIDQSINLALLTAESFTLKQCTRNGKLIAENTAFFCRGVCMYVCMRDHSSNRMCVWFSAWGELLNGGFGLRSSLSIGRRTGVEKV